MGYDDYSLQESSYPIVVVATQECYGCFTHIFAQEHFHWHVARPVSFTFTVFFITSEFIKSDNSFG